MKIIHICSYYIGSMVYRNLFEHLSFSDKGCQQYIFIPIRETGQADVNFFLNERVTFYYTKCLSVFTKISFLLKQLFLLNSFRKFLSKNQNLIFSNIIHAHTLYSDGFLAFFLSLKYKIPYVVTVRTTDVNIFEKYAFHWRYVTKMVLSNAKVVVFISDQHRSIIENNYNLKHGQSLTIPNGIDPFWIKNSVLRKNKTCRAVKFGIYVGSINKNKNLKNSILAFFASQIDGDSRFIVIGGTYLDYQMIYGTLDPIILNKTIFYEKTSDKNFIRKQLLDSDVLIVPSYLETFGLVYLEAISQCTPVVYSSGQGFEGVFPDGDVGFKCDPHDIFSIKQAINMVLDKFPIGLDFYSNKFNPVRNFSWEKIVSRYIDEVY